MKNYQEVVINKQFGGFGLSMKAEEEYAKRKGFKLFFYTQTKYKWRDGKEEFKKIIKQEDSKAIWFSLKTDLGKVVNELPENTEFWFSTYDIERDDKDLVAVVKALGAKANGEHATLRIVKIPKGVEWIVDEYDGLETLEEKHKVFG